MRTKRKETTKPMKLVKLHKEHSAQALLELAIFGAILIILLGTLVSYGVRYNFEQRTMMNAFRGALQESGNYSQGGQANYMLIQDNHVPNPASPFGIGSVSPSYSSASVIRSCRLHETADWATPAELPQTVIQAQDKRFVYKTAGFRRDSITCGSYKRYEEVYGNGVWIASIASGTTPDPYGNPQPVHYRNCYEADPTTAATVNIIDSCEGEIISYDGCKRQCRIMTDDSFCERECNRGKPPGSTKNCGEVCSYSMDVPWYCTAMDDIFSFAIAYNKRKAMGVQSDFDKVASADNTLTTRQSGASISSTDNIDWSEVTNRDIIYNANLDGSGIAKGVIDIRSQESSSKVEIKATKNYR